MEADELASFLKFVAGDERGKTKSSDETRKQMKHVETIHKIRTEMTDINNLVTSQEQLTVQKNHRENKNVDYLTSSLEQLSIRKHDLEYRHMELCERQEKVQAVVAGAQRCFNDKLKEYEVNIDKQQKGIEEKVRSLESIRKYLGLEIKKLPKGNGIVLIFSCIDPEQPERPYTCSLQLQKSHYKVVSCNPPIDVSAEVNTLNHTKCLRTFVQTVRDKFKALVSTQH